MIDQYNPDFSSTPASALRPRFGYRPQDATAAPFVSIITPFYNTGAVFHETAGSVLRQSFQQWEWLIVNDGSSNPEALSILNEYRAADPRIRVVDLEVNGGPSRARNTGFRLARAEYVVCLDTDNLLEPTAIEKWLWFLESYPEYGFSKGYTVGFGAQHYLHNRGFHEGEVFLHENLVDMSSMLRKSIHKAVGGFDESMTEGMEDWDFWLRCASYGFWGGTVLEYLDWYRRRPSHADRWADWDCGERQQSFHQKLRERYPGLWAGGFPRVSLRPDRPNDLVPDDLPCENRLRKESPRLLMVLPWLEMGGADKFNLDLVKELAGRGWEITVATTLESNCPRFPHFTALTPDVFVMPRFLRLVDYPRFLRYLVQSRQVDAVMVSHSELGYLLLPYLGAHFPDVPLLDLCHIEEEQWKSGSYPRMAVQNQEVLDLNVVVSEHLKRWMVDRGADPARIEVCHINVHVER